MNEYDLHKVAPKKTICDVFCWLHFFMAKACYSLAAVVFCLCVGKELVDGARRDPEFQSRLRVMDIDETDLKQLLGTKFAPKMNNPKKSRKEFPIIFQGILMKNFGGEDLGSFDFVGFFGFPR